MRHSLLTIIIPTFNNSKIFDRMLYLENASFCHQHGLQIIICDDSTNENVYSRVKDISHYTYCKHERTGNPVDNWNFGHSQATCQYSWLLHHDEFVQNKDDFLKILEELKHTQSHGVFLKLKKIYNHGSSVFRPRIIQILCLRMPKILYFANQLGSPSVLIHRRTSERYNRQLKWLVDVDFFVKFINKYSVQLIDVPVYSDSSMKESITNKIDNKYQLHIDELDVVKLNSYERFMFKVLLRVKSYL